MEKTVEKWTVPPDWFQNLLRWVFYHDFSPPATLFPREIGLFSVEITRESS